MWATKYGDIAGQIPVITGQIYWVAPSASYTLNGKSYTASDGNDGKDPRRAFLTLDYAIGKTTASVGDVIVLLPGSHSWTGTTTVDVAGITITGLSSNSPAQGAFHTSQSGRRNRAQVTCTGGDVLTVQAADVEISWLHFVPPAGYASIEPNASADRLYVHDCTFYVATAADTDTAGVSFAAWTGTTASNDGTIIRNCYFEDSDANGPAIHVGGTTKDLLIEQCSFVLVGATAWADAVQITVDSLGTVIRDCDFIERASGTVITDSIDNAGATTDGATTVLRCYFPVGSNSLTNSNVADNQCAENYLMQAAANVGGTLVLST